MKEIKSLSEVLAFILPRNFSNPSGNENAIEQRHIMIYGGAGSGKTNTLMYIGECLKKFYRDLNVNIAWADADLEALFEQITDAQVQLLCCEDMTRIKQPEEAIHKYFTIRHLVAEKTGRRWGLVVTAFTTHDLFGIQPKSLRTNVDLTIFLETPSDIYDIRIAKEMLGEDLFNQLKEYEKMNGKGYAAYVIKWDRGIVFIPKATVNFITEERSFNNSNLNGILKKILKEIWMGANTEGLLSYAFPTLHPDAIKEALNKLTEKGLIIERGLIFKKWYLTLKGASIVER